MERRPPLTVLIADDDPDDRLLVSDALAETPTFGDVREVADGEELMDYLLVRGRFTHAGDAPRPDVILLDLNMPKMGGREVLAEIRHDPVLRRIPIVVMSTSGAEEDVDLSYELGANSFVRKPASFGALTEAMKTLGSYWATVVTLPGSPTSRGGAN